MARPDAQDLWREYERTGDQHLRDRLIMSYAPLVKFIAYRKAAELPARCNVEDLISAGLVELIAAIDRYDPEKGATLEQYAWTRVHGAVLDQLRKLDWAPRSVRRTQRQIDTATREFGAACTVASPPTPS
jgi:RNA polymerase sigma factor for flagellar operon FliA